MRANRVGGCESLAMEIEEAIAAVEAQIQSLDSRYNAANAELVEMMADNSIEAIVVDLQVSEMAVECDIVSGQVDECAKIVDSS